MLPSPVSPVAIEYITVALPGFKSPFPSGCGIWPAIKMAISVDCLGNPAFRTERDRLRPPCRGGNIPAGDGWMAPVPHPSLELWIPHPRPDSRLAFRRRPDRALRSS